MVNKMMDNTVNGKVFLCLHEQQWSDRHEGGGHQVDLQHDDHDETPLRNNKSNTNWDG